MKITTILLLLPFICFSQKVDIKADESGHYSYQEIIQANGKNVKEIHAVVKKWLAMNYRMMNLEMDDIETGQIICKGSSEVQRGDEVSTINHTVVLEIKDNKLRVTMTNFSHLAQDTAERSFSGKMSLRKWQLKAANKRIQILLERLRTALKHSGDDDW